MIASRSEPSNGHTVCRRQNSGMPLTLRPTHPSRDPDANDWSIHEDGEEIGRLGRILIAIAGRRHEPGRR